MSFLDSLIYGIRDVYNDAVAVARRSRFSFSSDFTVSDDAVNEWTRVEINPGTNVTPTSSSTLTNKTIVLASNTVTDTSATTGDIPRHNGTRFVRLARGTANQVLRANALGTDIGYAKIVDANVDAAAAIDATKLAAGTIVNANVSGSAAIAVSKLAGSATAGYALRDVAGVPTWSAFADPSTCGLRLTLTTAVPVTTSDVTGASTVYLTPDASGAIALYDGTAWHMRTTAEVSIALSGLTSGKNYDVFAYWTGSAVALELSAAWTNDTTRADALAKQDGVDVKSGTTTRRLVGTIRTTGTTTTEDSVSKRFVWNRYNRRQRALKVVDTTNTWLYSSANSVWRQANASTANKVEILLGLAGDMVEASVSCVAAPTSATTVYPSVGVGVDSTTANSAQVVAGNHSNNTFAALITAHYRGTPGLGYHAINWLETGPGAVEYIYLGGNGTTITQSGLVGSVAA